jgi:hypothetical protein
VKKLLIVAALALVVLAPATYAYLTPYLALGSIRDAAKAGDAAALSEHVDFQALRESLKLQIQERLDRGAQQSQHPLAAFGSLLAGALAAPAVDSLVTPENVTKLLGGQDVGSSEGPKIKLDADDLRMGYQGLNAFEVSTAASSATGVRLILERRGALSWKLTDIRLAVYWQLPPLGASPAP